MNAIRTDAPAGDEAEARWLGALCRQVEADDPLPAVGALAERAGCDVFRLNRLFHKHLGLAPGAYIEGVRRARITRALRQAPSVTDAVYAAGLGSSRALYERAPVALGMTPGEYRAGGAGLDIAYACGATRLGQVAIGATARGICFLQFGDTPQALRAALATEFPRAQLRPMAAAAQPQFDAWMRALDAHLDGRPASAELPLDLQGTAFQMRVWRYLRTIPSGQVVSYAEAANAIGAPRAARAVASACAHNRVAVLVPCHRVIRGDGSVGGYRWGLARKCALLAAEAAGADS